MLLARPRSKKWLLLVHPATTAGNCKTLHTKKARFTRKTFHTKKARLTRKTLHTKKARLTRKSKGGRMCCDEGEDSRNRQRRTLAPFPPPPREAESQLLCPPLDHHRPRRIAAACKLRDACKLWGAALPTLSRLLVSDRRAALNTCRGLGAGERNRGDDRRRGCCPHRREHVLNQQQAAARAQNSAQLLNTALRVTHRAQDLKRRTDKHACMQTRVWAYTRRYAYTCMQARAQRKLARTTTKSDM
eukprot:360359-Chlamydomonas_euryale.AAC.5